MFRTAETEIHPEEGRSAIESLVIRAWPAHRAGPYREPGPPWRGVRARAELNHGRWIVSCPYCPGAMPASEADHRTLCLDCLHEGTSASGRWIPVDWPRDRAAIEAAVAGRPAENRNWSPGETAAHLRAENRAHAGELRRWRRELERRQRDRVSAGIGEG